MSTSGLGGDLLKFSYTSCHYLCNLGGEDEVHFLVNGPQCENLREPFLVSCRELRPQFQFYFDREKFIYMMTNPHLTANVNMSKFLYSAFDDNGLFLEAKTTLGLFTK